jgi:hypothetical protein
MLENGSFLKINEEHMETGSVLDSIRAVDPDSESGSGSRRAKITHKNRKRLRNFMF